MLSILSMAKIDVLKLKTHNKNYGSYFKIKVSQLKILKAVAH